MSHRHPGLRPPLGDLSCDGAHLLLDHPGVGLVLQVRDLFPARGVAHDAGEGADGAGASVRHGSLQTSTIERLAGQLEEHSTFRASADRGDEGDLVTVLDTVRPVGEALVAHRPHDGRVTLQLGVEFPQRRVHLGHGHLRDLQLLTAGSCLFAEPGEEPGGDHAIDLKS